MQRKFNTIIFLVIVILFLVLVLPGVNKPLIGDEIGFALAADAAAKTGNPKFWFEEESGYCTGLWHPPLYVYLLASSVKLFGISETSLRSVSVLFSVATLILIYFLTVEIFKNEERKKSIALTACFLYAINPFVAQSSLLLDIDATLLPFMITLFVYALIRSNEILSKRFVWLGLLFTALLWTKISTPLLLLFIIFIFYLMRREWKKSILCVAIGTIGALLFFITWYLYCIAINADFLETFKHTIFAGAGFFGTYTPSSHALWSVWCTRTFVFWATPFFSILIFMTIIKRIKSYCSTKEINFIDLLILYSAFILIFFIIVRPLALTLLRYSSSCMPFFAILVAWYIKEDFCLLTKIKSRKRLLWFCVIVAVMIIYFMFVLKDPILISVPFHTTQMKPLLIETSIICALYLMSFLIAMICLKLLYFQLNIRTMFVIVLSILTVSASLSLSYLQTNANYATTYEYGETGLTETAEYIKAHTTTNNIIISSSDVAYYAQRRYYHQDVIRNITKFQKIISENNISYIVVRERFLYESPEMRATIEQNNYKLIERIGVFNIYRR